VARLLLATGQTFVIISGGIDLSLGFIMGLAAVVCAHVVVWANPMVPPVVAVLLGFGAGVLIACVPGAVNGFLVAYLKVPPFIGTWGCSAWRAAWPSSWPAGPPCRRATPFLSGHRQRPLPGRHPLDRHHRGCLRAADALLS
jgi:hypothetical protein